MVYRMELPGFEAKEVEVRLVDHMLVVEAKTAAAPEKKEEAPSRYYRREIELPARLDAAKVEAVYRNGMLEVHVPRLPEVEGRRIEVKT
ncbi:MAG: Hsp20/alpha crystallin family protein [Gemmataceae bacterium]